MMTYIWPIYGQYDDLNVPLLGLSMASWLEEYDDSNDDISWNHQQARKGQIITDAKKTKEQKFDYK